MDTRRRSRAIPMDISVIIPTFNSRDLLMGTLRALLGQDCAADRYEIIVLDDGSTDGSDEAVRHLDGPVRLVYERQENQGRGAARNAGARLARSPVLLFLDADVRPAPGFLSGHIRHHAAHRRAGVQGRTLQAPETLTTTFMRATNLLPDLTIRRKDALSPLHVITRNFSVTADAFWNVGGFDEAFVGYGWEDIELAMRLQEAGVPLHYEPEALAYHHHVQRLEDLMPKLRQAGQGAVYFWRKHGRTRRLGLFLEIDPLMLPLKWLVFRTPLITPAIEAIRPWAERHAILPLCSECYNHLLWRAYYDGAFAALSAPGRPPEPRR
jgi:glycosyltransferase involved in cell wall biosynthesis